ncbi:RNA12 protein-domain-containing protein [Pisolithus microcarpus]|nr:RNA12 protein-domain-containing protein [Pisolithus microcarpus]
MWCANHPLQTREAWLFVDSVFPIRLGIWDIRYYVGVLREESLLDSLGTRLSAVKTHGFKVLSLEPYPKDGGVFVHFSYAAHETEEHAIDAIESDLKDEIESHGGMPSWLGLSRGSVWLVKGRPWREDMNRYPSTVVKVAFEGPDIREEALYHLYRPYGRIYNISPPAPVPSGMLRFSQIAFQRVRSATVARNVTHGFHLPKEGSVTRLLTSYERPLQAHAIRDWITGTLTYTVFDPIRTLFMLNCFDFREYDVYKWLRRQALDRLVLRQEDMDDSGPDQDVWRERRAAEIALRSYLADLPGTVVLVHGPQGSGKWRMVSTVIRDTGRKALVIDYAELNKAPSDSRLVAALAQQTGYRPIFTFLNSLNNLIDIATMGVIGQKAGLSSSLQDQLKQILEVVGTALRRVSRRLQSEAKQRIEAERQTEARRECEVRVREAIRAGTWHDPRLDAVVGVGVISELGVGDEPLNGLVISSSGSKDAGALAFEERRRAAEGELARKERSMKETRTIESLPVVVIKNYAARGRTNRQELLEVLSQWAATLIENQVAHVVVISENRENAKLLARALPSKPLNFIALSDADVQSALSFVKKRLRDAVITFELTPEQTACVERLGGRASDLESLIHKVHSGQSIEDAVEDIISRAVGELRKNAFGEDTDEAKMLPCKLSQKPELPYYQILVDFPFKGDEAPLRAMENAELISIVIWNDRLLFAPGRPVLKYCFQQLVHDPVFQATQDLALNQTLISSAETAVKSCESELNTLQEMAVRESWTHRLWGRGRASAERMRYLSRKIKIQSLEKQNAELRRVLDKQV